MQRTVTETKTVIHNICSRCKVDLTESGECVCDELSKDEIQALNAV